MKHLSTESVIEDLARLYVRLVDLGVEYQNGQISLKDLEEINARP